jgi:hypothetical protein
MYDAERTRCGHPMSVPPCVVIGRGLVLPFSHAIALCLLVGTRFKCHIMVPCLLFYMSRMLTYPLTTYVYALACRLAPEGEQRMTWKVHRSVCVLFESRRLDGFPFKL